MRKIWIICALVLLSFGATGWASEDEMVIQHRESNQPLITTASATHAGAQITNDATASTYIRMSGLFLIVLGCCVGGVVLYFKRRSAKAALSKQAARLVIQERLSFGPNREFILLKACDRMLVVAAQNGQAVLLTDMASEESTPQPAPVAPQLEEDPITYESVLARATRRLDTTRPRTPAPQVQSWPEVEGVLR